VSEHLRAYRHGERIAVKTGYWVKQSILRACDGYAFATPHHVVVVQEKGEGGRRSRWAGYTIVTRVGGRILAEAGGEGYTAEYMRGYVDGSGLLERIGRAERAGHYVGGKDRLPLREAA
jgi:hypothetical protein